MVNTGAPGVRVLSENRFVGETDEDGRLLVSGLRSHQRNTISIDPAGLPINADIDMANQEVIPAFKSGVFVDFKVETKPSSAILILKRPDGSFVEAGLGGRIEGSDGPFVVGYDGQAYVKNLGASNTAVIKLGSGECRATFAFEPKEDTQAVIGPVVCQ